MRQNRACFLKLIFVVSLTAALLGCSSGAKKQDPDRPAQPQSPLASTSAGGTQAASSSAAAQPAQSAVPASDANPGGKPSGPPATEKYQFKLTNYAKVPVTVTVNGEWLGQWDQSASVPLQPVFQGKNQLTVELGGKPENDCTAYIVANRAGQDVTIMTLSFQGQTGTHSYTFVAK